MSQPVKLSDALVLDARLSGGVAERSIAGQVEFWAKLGRAVELMLNGRQVSALCRQVAVRPVSELVEGVNRPEGRARLQAYLESKPFPHFLPAAGEPGMLERRDADGTVTVGRFVNRKFVAQAEQAKG